MVENRSTLSCPGARCRDEGAQHILGRTCDRRRVPFEKFERAAGGEPTHPLLLGASNAVDVDLYPYGCAVVSLKAVIALCEIPVRRAGRMERSFRLKGGDKECARLQALRAFLRRACTVRTTEN